MLCTAMYIRMYSYVSFRESQTDYVQPLPLPKLLSLCESSYFIHYLSSCDHILYQAIVDTLIPDVLKPIPGNRRHVS